MGILVWSDDDRGYFRLRPAAVRNILDMPGDHFVLLMQGKRIGFYMDFDKFLRLNEQRIRDQQQLREVGQSVATPRSVSYVFDAVSDDVSDLQIAYTERTGRFRLEVRGRAVLSYNTKTRLWSARRAAGDLRYPARNLTDAEAIVYLKSNFGDEPGSLFDGVSSW